MLGKHTYSIVAALALALAPVSAARAEPTPSPSESVTRSTGTLSVHRYTQNESSDQDATATPRTPQVSVIFIAERVVETAPAPTPAPAVGSTGGPTLPITALPNPDAVRAIAMPNVAISNSKGVAYFGDLPAGLYRVSEDSNQPWKARTFLVRIPTQHPEKPGEWLWDIDAYPKLVESTATSVSSPLSLTRTGPGIVLLIGSIACLSAAGITIARIRKKEN